MIPGLGFITYHSLFFALGAVVAGGYVAYHASHFHRSAEWAVERVLLIFVGGLFAARLGYLVAYPAEFTQAGQLFAIWQGGLVSFAGLLGGGMLLVATARRLPESQRAEWLALLTRATLLGWAIGRWGNYFMHESGGVASAWWRWTGGHVPIQIFESVWCLILFLWLWRKPPRPQVVLPVALTGYLVGRFVIDTWRDEAVGLGLHVSQWVALVGLGCLLLRIGLDQRKRKP